jgi:hypothetical protein
MADAEMSASTSQATPKGPNAELCRRLRLTKAAALSKAALATPAQTAISQPRPR